MTILSRLNREKAPPPTVRDLLIARSSPWHRVAPIVIDTILDSITDKGLLEAFVLQSMNAGLIVKYEAFYSDTNSEVIRAQICQILCATGNSAIPSLAKTLDSKQMDSAAKALALASDTFEAAIALVQNQIAAYTGLAAVYGLVGKIAESQKYAKLGLLELDKIRANLVAVSLRYRTAFPAGMLDQAEKKLRTYLKL